MGRERLECWPAPQCVTQQNHPASILPGFPSQAFPTVVASLRSPRAISPQSTAELAWDCSLISMLQLSATELSRGLMYLSGCGLDYLCDSIQTVTDKLLHSPSASNASSLSQTDAPVWGSDPCFTSPARRRSSPPHSHFLCPHSFVLPSFAWFRILFSGG